MNLRDIICTPDKRLSLGRVGHLVGLISFTWGFVYVTARQGYVEGMWWAYGAMTGLVFLANKGISAAKRTVENVKGIKNAGPAE